MFTPRDGRCGRVLIHRARAMHIAAGAAVSLALLAGHARAQYVWTGGATGNWNTTTNWQGGSAPVSGASTTLTFSPGNNAAAITATQNIGTPFVVNAVTLNNMSVANALTINGTAGNTFQFVGPSSTIALQGAGGATFSATGATMQLASNLTFTGSGMGNVTLSGAISETGGARSLTIATTPATQCNGFVNLGVASTYTGGVTLNGGNLQLSGFTGAGLGTGSLTIGPAGGVLYPSTSSISLSVPNLNVNGALRILSVSTGLSLNTTLLTGSAPITINGTTVTGFVVGSNSAGYTGAVTLDRFDLPQMSSGASGLQLTGVNGALSGVTTYNVRAGNSLWANNATASVAANNDRIANTATINLSSGTLQVSGSSTTSSPQSNVTEVVGAVNGAGFSTFQATTTATVLKSTTISVNSAISRAADRGTFLFRGANLGGAAGSLTANSTLNTDGSQNFDGANTTSYVVLPASAASGLVGGAGAAGSTTLSILPYAVGDGATTNTGTGTSFVTLDAVSGSSSLSVRPLTTAEYATDLVSGATTNARLTTATSNTGTATVNSLNLASGVVDGSITGSGTLNVTSGAILANTSITSTGASIANNLAFGSAEAQIFTPGLGGLTISGNMTGNAGLTKSGGGSNSNTLFLTGDNSGLTGQLTINAGVINFAAASSLPGTGAIVTNGTGVGTTGAAVGLFYSGATPYTLSRDIAANSGWLTLKALDTGAGGALTVGGQISGGAGLALQANAGADIWIPRTDNTYTGPTSIGSSAAAVHIAGDGSLGAGGAVNIAGTLVLEGDWNTGRHINNGGMTINTNGHNASLNGPMTNFTSGSISGQFANAAFNKTGAGTLAITSNANALAGPVNVNGGTLLVNGTLAASTTNAVTVNTGATLGGSGVIYRNINVLSGGTLSPGNSPGVLTEYGNLSVAAGATFLADLNGPAAGNGAGNYDRLVVNGTVTLTGSTLATNLGYLPASSDIFFVLTNDGADAITGAFSGLPEGSTVLLGIINPGATPISATISYLGDAATGSITGGNDVVLYNIVPAPGVATLLSLGGLLAARRRR